MRLSKDQKKEIIDRLAPCGPEKIILFGSYAWGEPDENSDIDLYVVTGDDFFPENFREKMSVVLRISKALYDFKKKNPTDLIVHTRPMHKKFVELNSSFSREIMKKGVILYDRDMA